MVLMVALALATAGAFAQEEGSTTGWWGSYYTPGNISFGAEVGLGSGPYGSSTIDLSGGAEFIITKFRPADILAIDLGASARGIFSLWRLSLTGPRYSAFGGAGSVVAHLGFRGFDFPFAEYLERLDLFASVGLGFLGYSYGGDWTGFSQPDGGLKFVTSEGVNYFLTDNIAVSLVYTYWRDWSSVSIGARFKLGPKEELNPRVRTVLDDLPSAIGAMTGNLAYAQFSAYYWLVLGYGGFIADDESFAEGDGVRWLMRYPDDADQNEMEYTRALLRINSDGSKWWRVVFEVDDETAEYEYLVDRSDAIQLLRFVDMESGEVVTHAPGDPDSWWGGARTTMRSREDLKAMSEGSERVRVPGGTFRAERVTAREDVYEYTWWYTDEVPGLLVKLEGYEDNTLIVAGELQEILTGVTTPWEVPW